MGHYRANITDTSFALYELFNLRNTLENPIYKDMDVSTVQDILKEVKTLAEEPLSTSLLTSDRRPPVYDPKTKTVTIPEDFKKSYQALVDAQWWRLEIPEELGGIPAPPSVRWAVAEMLLGSNPAAFMYSAGFAFSGILYDLGNEEQQQLAHTMIDKEWGATMVLTEPDAGSDVGAGTTKAYLQEDGTWRIEGVKRFITSGEHDMSENIIHFVLARPIGVEGAGGPGTKGLSLFIVPKYQINHDGTLGDRNGVYATNVEHKMGLKASTTCELTFGADHLATGTLLGDVHNGIAQMFQIIEYARMMVGTKAIATLSTGYLNALDYAKLRVQGTDMTQMLNKTAPKVPIIKHPDVRRSLLTQKAYAEGLRAVMLYTAHWQDRRQNVISGQSDADGYTVQELESVNDLLLPVVKGVGSERSYEQLAQSLQTLGGSGYLQDYPIEQYIRDAKIDTLYEGTTAIQAMDFYFRKIVRNNSQAYTIVMNEITKVLMENPAHIPVTRGYIETATVAVQSMLTTMNGWLGESFGEPKTLYQVGLNATRLLYAFGDLLTGFMLLWEADKANALLVLEDKGGYTTEYLTGKIATAQFYAETVLPRLTSDAESIKESTLVAMEMSDESF